MDIKIDSLEKAKKCIDRNQSFVMQGGAGSGKTETLKELLQYLSINYPEKRVVCITHTNLAVEEIKSRVGDKYLISTIHSFLHSLIKDYRKNIKEVISDIFIVPLMERGQYNECDNENEYKKNEHEKYKKAYEKYNNRLFIVKKENAEKYAGKRDYDKEPEVFNAQLNNCIELLNREIKEIISAKDYSKITYNETKFNNFSELSYGHDGLLAIAHLLFKNYKLLGKIIKDRFDCIFIDEYQDTNKNIINIFLEILQTENHISIGLFGDTMQSIYSDGIGDVKEYIKSNRIINIPKEDNYRCSEQVLTFINALRTDDIKQEVAFKKKADGTLEILSDRQGRVKVFYALCDNKPSAYDSAEEKKAYIDKIDKLIELSLVGENDYKILLLTNKAIAKRVGFENLYDIFDKRYVEANEYIDAHLNILQVINLCELCELYETKNYNPVINSIKQAGFKIRKMSDKIKIKETFDKIINCELDIIGAVELAFELKLLKKSETYIQYIDKKDLFLNQYRQDEKYLQFKKAFDEGHNTYNRMNKIDSAMQKDQFEELERIYKKERFYTRLFSGQIKFCEAREYFDYINEKTSFITMHKTKGSGIDNVLVVLDEYFWNSEYNFSLIYNNDVCNQLKIEKMKKLVYVACSRAKTNLICVRLISPNEEADFKAYFKTAIKKIL